MKRFDVEVHDLNCDIGIPFTGWENLRLTIQVLCSKQTFLQDFYLIDL